MATKKKVIQKHHVTYDPEITVPMTKGEHFILTRFSWLKTPSVSFLDALEAHVMLARLKKRWMTKDAG